MFPAVFKVHLMSTLSHRRARFFQMLRDDDIPFVVSSLNNYALIKIPKRTEDIEAMKYWLHTRRNYVRHWFYI